MKPRISIVIPAVHEEQSITDVLANIEKYVKTPHEIIVVNDDDGSDRTGDVVSSFAASHPGVTLIRKQKTARSGFARALYLGFRQAQGEYVIPVMADGCDRYSDIDIMYTKACDGWDVVCASRYVPGAKKSGGPRVQSFLSRCVCWAVHLFTGIPTADATNSFKLYKRSFVRQLDGNVRGGTEISMDLTLRAFYSGANIVDIPTYWRGGKPDRSELAIFRRTLNYSRVLWYCTSQEFELHPLPWVVATLGLAIFLAYWQTTRLYFWGDDWDVFFKVLNPEDTELWHLGPGIFGKGSYRYLHTPFALLFPFFGLHAGWYWAVGIVLYFIAALSVYALTRELTGKPGVALAAALLFGVSGYIGSYTTYHLSNLYQMLFAVIGICWTLWAFFRYLKTTSPVYYFGSLVLFWASIEFVFLRTSGILLLLSGLALLYRNKFRFTSMVVRLVPFFLIFVFMYMTTPVSGQSGMVTVRRFSESIVKEGHWNYLLYPFGTLGNVVVPDAMTERIAALFLLKQEYVAIVVGIVVLALSFFASGKLGVFGLLWFFSQYAGYFLMAPRDSLLPTAHRYLTTSLVGVAMVSASLVYIAYRKKQTRFVLIIGGIVIYLVTMITIDTDATVKAISDPTRKFYRDVQMLIPSIDEDSIVHFELFADPPLIYRFRSNYPSSALAIFYGLTTHANAVDSKEDLVNAYKRMGSRSTVYSLYVTENGIIDTSERVRRILHSL